MKLNNKIYDVLKYVALIALPAFGSFWMVIGAVWGLPHTDEVVKTIVALGTLLGALLLLSSVQYNNSDLKYDGFIDPVEANRQTDSSALNLGYSGGVTSAEGKKDLLLKVRPRSRGI